METILHWFATGVGLLTLASFGWAPVRYFSKPQKRPLPQKLTLLAVYSIGVLQGVALLVWNDPVWWRELIGVGVYGAALALFWYTIQTARAARLATFFETTVPQKLLTSGPYRYVRHPFYTSYLIGWTAGCITTGWWPLLITLPVAFVIYTIAARNEECFLESLPWGGEYRQYRQQTGRFFPKLQSGETR